MAIQLGFASSRRAVLALRREVRDREVGPMLKTIECQIEHRYGGYLPIRSRPARDRRGRFTPHPELGPIVAAKRGYYRPNGVQVTSGSCFAPALDKVFFEEGSAADISNSVDELAVQLEEGRSLRGRGGRYGMIEAGLDNHWVSNFGDCYGWILAGQLDDTAEKLLHDAISALQPSPPTALLKARQHWYEGLAANVDDEDYLSFADNEPPLWDEDERQTLALFVYYGGVSWRELVALKLALKPLCVQTAQRKTAVSA